MKAWTLLFVILFWNIYKKYHISACYIINNGFLRTIVKDCYDFTNTAESGSQILSGIHATNTVFAMINTFFHTIENKQKLTTITTDSGAEMSAENGNDHTGLFNNPELENPNFKRKSMGTDYPSGKIKLRCTRSKRTIVETTLIKSNFI